jgi:hypothetical protein
VHFQGETFCQQGPAREAFFFDSHHRRRIPDAILGGTGA